MKFQAYINRPFQTSSRTYTPEPSERTAKAQDPPHLPEPSERIAQDQAPPLLPTCCPGQELCIHCSRVGDAQIHTSLSTLPFLSQPPFSVQISHFLEALSSPRSLLQPADVLLGSLPGSADETAQPRYSGQPNAHLHGGIGVIEKSLFLLTIKST